MAAFVLFLAVAAGLQYLGGAYHMEFSGYYDEPAHYVTGLMIRQYVAEGFPGPPLEFAETYYLHYPKVALGQWPPVFYLIQAPWTLLFSPERASVLLLMAVLASLLALAVFHVAEPEFGFAGAVLSGLLLLALPLNQISTQQIMAEIPVALLGFLAVLAFGHYLETRRWTGAAAFGVLASLAILTKGTALWLALVPALAIVLARRMDLVFTGSFWLPVAIVAVLCGPWYALTAGGVVNTFGYAAGWTYTREAIGVFAVHAARAIGFVLVPVVCVGVAVKLAPLFRRRPVPGQWAAVAALAVSVYVLHILVPAAYDNRFLVSLTPALVLFLAAGLAWLGSRVPPATWPVGARRALLVAACSVVFLLGTFYVPSKTQAGFIGAAESILARPGLRNAVTLVAAQPASMDGEGMLIAEIAMREESPRRFVLRATKALTRTDFNGIRDEPFYTTPTELMAYLDEVPVGVVVLYEDRRPAKFRHHDLLVRTIREHPGRFELISRHEGAGIDDQPGEVLVYRVVGNEDPAPGRVHLDKDRLLPGRLR